MFEDMELRLGDIHFTGGRAFLALVSIWIAPAVVVAVAAALMKGPCY